MIRKVTLSLIIQQSCLDGAANTCTGGGMVFIQGQTVTVTDTEQGSQWQNVLAWRACNLQGLRRPIQSYKLLFKLFFFSCGTGVWTQGFALAKQALYCWSHTPSPFCSGYFGDGASWALCPGWTGTLIFLISASHIARITGVSHWVPRLVWGFS
jgi:hypothetical protein